VKNKFLARADEALSAFRNERQRLRYLGHSIYSYIPRQEARALYDGGSGVKDLADLYGCSAAAVREILYQAGATLRNNYRHDVTQELVAKMYRQGATGVAIAKELGTSQATIYKRLDDEGVERRKRVTSHPRRNKRRNPVPPEEAAAMYRKYGSISSVAEKLGICYESANRLILDGGAKPQRSDRTDITIKRAVQAYRSCGNIHQAAKKLGCHQYALSARLIAAGEIEYRSNLSDDVTANILREFDDGKSVYALSKDYHVGKTPLRLLLLAHDRKTRSPYKTLQVPLASLARSHTKGEPIYKLAKEVGIDRRTLSRKLKAAGYKVRLDYERYELPKGLIKKICRRFEVVCSVSQVARETKYSRHIVSNVLREHDYEIPLKPNQRIFTLKEEKAIYKAYDTGASLSTLMLTYGLKTRGPIRTVIVASGRRIRTPHEQVELDRRLRLDKLLET